jgi:putative transposase
VTWAIEKKGYSQRRACGLIGLEPKTYRYASTRPDDAGLRANERWSLDFVSDVLADGRRFRVLVVVDDFTRECLALVADTSLSGRRVARELDRIVAYRGRPLMIVSDNGTELDVARDPALAGGSWDRMALHRSRQAATERLRREPERPLPRRVPQRASLPRLAIGPPDRRGLADRLQPHRPHTSLGGLTPNEFATRSRQDQNQNGLWL